MTRTAADLSLAGVPAVLWSAASEAPHRLLMLDYDGTLAPFHSRPEEALPGPRVLFLVARIASSKQTTVALISGRPLSDLTGLLGRLPALLIGEHGWDALRPGGRIERYDLPPGCAASLQRAAEAADASGWGGRVERKRASIVLHTRGLPRDQAEALLRAGREAWEEAARQGDLRLDSIDGGLELRARGRDKGMAVRALVARCPRGTIAVYLGDDTTDEDAFREVRPAGYGLRVGSDERDSLAVGRLPSVEAVEDFLERWLDIVEVGEAR